MVNFETFKWCDVRVRSHEGVTQYTQRTLCWLTWCMQMIFGYYNSSYGTPRAILRMKLDYVYLWHACLVLLCALRSDLPNSKDPSYTNLSNIPAAHYLGRMLMIAIWWRQLKVFIRTRSLPQGTTIRLTVINWGGCWQKSLPQKTVQPRLTKQHLFHSNVETCGRVETFNLNTSGPLGAWQRWLVEGRNVPVIYTLQTIDVYNIYIFQDISDKGF